MSTPRIDSIETDIEQFNRNIIINSDMGFWQRGVTFTGLGANQIYTADRLQWAGGTITAVLTGSRATTSGTGNAAILPKECTYAARFAVTTAQAVLGAGASAAPWIKIEGYDAVEVLSSNIGFTFSFYMRAFRTGVYYVQFGNGNLGRIYCAPVTIAASNSWQKVTLFVATPDTTINTWNMVDGIGLIVRIWMAAGSNLIGAAPNEWFTVVSAQVGADQVNAVQSTSDYIEITGFDLHKGQYDRPYVKRGRSNQEELALCQRYFEKTYEIDTAPGTSTPRGLLNCKVLDSASLTRLFMDNGNRFHARKRITPTVLFWSENGTANSISIYDNVTSLLTVTSSTRHSAGFDSFLTVSASASASKPYVGHYTADAEL